MKNYYLDFRPGWLSVRNFDGGHLDNLVHFSSVTSPVTPQVRAAAFIGRMLKLGDGEQIQTDVCRVRKFGGDMYVFERHEVKRFVLEPETTATYTFTLDEIKDVLVTLAKLIA